ncbi:AAA family ATPase [Patescibacteria group bacterium]|nr:AAA family ATPase [Patescibacteria group bacterium]
MAGLEDVFDEFKGEEGESIETEKEEPKPVVEEKPTVEEPKVKPIPQEVKVIPKAKSKGIQEATGLGKDVYTIFGEKGRGKTRLAFSFPGKIACLSFDKKSINIKVNEFDDNPRIKVYDVLGVVDYSTPVEWLESSDTAFRELQTLIDSTIKNFEPDWIVIDGSEIFQQMCEMVMRFRNNLGAFQGIANKNIWKERKLYMKQIHKKCLDVVKYGLIYTTYVDIKEIIKDGEIVSKTEHPKWADIVLFETDITLRVDSEQDKSGRKFKATVWDSKTKNIKTGMEKDITGKGIEVLMDLKT